MKSGKMGVPGRKKQHMLWYLEQYFHQTKAEQHAKWGGKGSEIRGVSGTLCGHIEFGPYIFL